MQQEYIDDELPLPSFEEVFGDGNFDFKKKKQATTSNNLLNVNNPSQTDAETTGRWTPEEHRLFLEGIMLYGKDWKKMQPLIKTRTLVQIRTHAQKVFKKIGLKKLPDPLSSNGSARAGMDELKIAMSSQMVDESTVQSGTSNLKEANPSESRKAADSLYFFEQNSTVKNQVLNDPVKLNGFNANSDVVNNNNSNILKRLERTDPVTYNEIERNAMIKETAGESNPRYNGSNPSTFRMNQTNTLPLPVSSTMTGIAHRELDSTQNSSFQQLQRLPFHNARTSVPGENENSNSHYPFDYNNYYSVQQNMTEFTNEQERFAAQDFDPQRYSSNVRLTNSIGGVDNFIPAGDNQYQFQQGKFSPELHQLMQDRSLTNSYRQPSFTDLNSSMPYAFMNGNTANNQHPMNPLKRASSIESNKETLRFAAEQQSSFLSSGGGATSPVDSRNKLPVNYNGYPPYMYPTPLGRTHPPEYFPNAPFPLKSQIPAHFDSSTRPTANSEQFPSQPVNPRR